MIRRKTAHKKEKLKEKIDHHIPLKKYTKGGRIACFMALCNIIVIFLAIIIAILKKGNAGIYVGFMMFAVLISAAVGFVIGINSFKEENKFLRFSYVGTVSNAVIWIGILGIYLIYV